MSGSITDFSGRYRFLSNFWTEKDGSTLEHKYQAAKTLDPNERDSIVCAKTAGEAKRLGRIVTMREDWDQIKDDVMLSLLRVKFAAGSALASQLLATAPADLVEGNTWNDRYWGQCPVGHGLNRLGELLMQVRHELGDST